MTNGLQRALGLELPVVQAPMAGVQDHALAVAVSNSGGLGSLPCAMFDAAALRRELSALKAGTGRPFNVNFFCHLPPVVDAGREVAWRAALAPYYREFGLDPAAITSGPGRMPFDAGGAELLEEFRPAVVSFHFGLPGPALLARVRAGGAKVFASATTVEEALWLEQRGVDAIIAQGLEAGGHRGHFLSDDLSRQAGTFALLPQIVRAVRTPVIAAGGIADAAGVAAALSLGAALVQVGTAYLLCPEATTSRIHRDALASDAARHTALTRLFTGRAARGIVNRLIRELEASGLAPEFPLAGAAIAPLRKAAEARGSGDFSPLWSGQNATGCRAVAAGELTRALAAV
ncbi:MAG: NAD(P)H-dependent flavin oxidoreductase [Caldimonas sp.]